MPYSAENRMKAKQYVDELRNKTYCEICGQQPIEWHREEHNQDSNLRIAHLRALGFPIPRIADEISKCTALCRGCHMRLDDRMMNLKYSGKKYDDLETVKEYSRIINQLREEIGA